MPEERHPRPTLQGADSSGHRPELSESRSWQRKIDDPLSFLVPFLLLSGLAIGGGGYDLFARHLAGILAWVLTGLLLLGPARGQNRPELPFGLIGGLLLLLGLLSALSSIWSSSVSVSLAEFERTVGYLGFFTAAYLIGRTPKQRELLGAGIAAGIAVIVLLAIGDRLIPGGEPNGAGFGINRLSFPLGYWNGDGIVFAAGFVLSVWFSSQTGGPRIRAAAMALAVLSATALYLTYSRGGLLVASISLILLFFLTENRLRMLGNAAIAASAAVPVLLMIDAYPAISGTGTGDPSAGESLAVLLVVLVSIAYGIAAFEATLRAFRRRPGLSARLLAVSRDRRALVAIAGTGVAALLISLAVFGSHAWDQFSDSDVPFPTDPQDHFTDLTGAYRYEFIQVALDTFADHPLIGTGAGTYVLEWSQQRPVPVSTQNAHSLYFENLAELGIVGGLITLALALTLIWFGITVWRRRRERDAAVILALTVALLLAFGLDWFWKLGTTAALLMLLAAWLTAARENPERRRKFGISLRATGVLAAWVAIIVLAVPAVADRYMSASESSVDSGDMSLAADRARTAAQLEPWAPGPHMQLGAIAESEGRLEEAEREFNRAIELEPESWQAWFLRYRLNLSRGRGPAAESDLKRMAELNPLFFDLRFFHSGENEAP